MTDRRLFPASHIQARLIVEHSHYLAAILARAHRSNDWVSRMLVTAGLQETLTFSIEFACMNSAERNEASCAADMCFSTALLGCVCFYVLAPCCEPSRLGHHPVGTEACPLRPWLRIQLPIPGPHAHHSPAIQWPTIEGASKASPLACSYGSGQPLSTLWGGCGGAPPLCLILHDTPLPLYRI